MEKRAEQLKETVIKTEEKTLASVKNIIKDIPEEFKRLDAYKICSYFLICAFIGWIWETVGVWIDTGNATDRGFLFIMHPISFYLPFLQEMVGVASIPLIWGLPIIPIYGVGGTAVCCLFRRWDRHPIELFFAGFIALTALELLSSYLCSLILHRQYWDYSGKFLNFQGRICFLSAMAWGTLCLVGDKLFAPRIDRLYMRIKTRNNFKIIIIVLVSYAVICALVKYFLDPTIIPN